MESKWQSKNKCQHASLTHSNSNNNNKFNAIERHNCTSRFLSSSLSPTSLCKQSFLIIKREGGGMRIWLSLFWCTTTAILCMQYQYFALLCVRVFVFNVNWREGQPPPQISICISSSSSPSSNTKNDDYDEDSNNHLDDDGGGAAENGSSCSSSFRKAFDYAVDMS